MPCPMPQVASATSPIIQILCEQIVSGREPVYLDVEAIDGLIENECFENVKSVIQKSGGTIQYGWQIWETLPTLMAEAEFHAVWVDPTGAYHDITPKSFPSLYRILFLPDPNQKYIGRQIDNIRIALRDEPLVKEFIQNAKQYYEATNRGDLADYHGDIEKIRTSEITNLIRRKNELFCDIVQKFYS